MVELVDTWEIVGTHLCTICFDFDDDGDSERWRSWWSPSSYKHDIIMKNHEQYSERKMSFVLLPNQSSSSTSKLNLWFPCVAVECRMHHRIKCPASYFRYSPFTHPYMLLLYVSRTLQTKSSRSILSVIWSLLLLPENFSPFSVQNSDL